MSSVSLYYDEAKLPRNHELVIFPYFNVPPSKWNSVPVNEPLIPLFKEKHLLGGRIYRVLAKYECDKSCPQRTTNGFKGVLEVGALFLSFGIVDLRKNIHSDFSEKKVKVIVALYANGQGAHPITKKMDEKMSFEKFIKVHNRYSNIINRPGIANGLLDRCIEVGNVHLMSSLIKNFGFIFLDKDLLMGDMIIYAVNLMCKNKLTVEKVHEIVSKLIELGAELNELSDETELLKLKHYCKEHSPLSVLDSVSCRFKKLKKSERNEYQSIVDLLVKNGADCIPGTSCCQLNTNRNEKIKLMKDTNR